jgi:hypothetical protein
MLPDRFDVECECEADHKAMLMWCRKCGRLYRFPPEAFPTKALRYANKYPADELMTVMVPNCVNCDSNQPAEEGAELLGRYGAEG